MLEKWKNIMGYEGIYQVSSLGRIKSTKGKEKILKPRIFKRGYLGVALRKNGTTKQYYIHRLVAETFIANKDNLPQVNHINGLKCDNNIKNLEWISSSNNMKHAYINKLTNGAKKQTLQYDLNGNFIKLWNSQTEASKATGIAHSHINNCCRGKENSAGGFIWKYSNNWRKNYGFK